MRVKFAVMKKFHLVAILLALFLSACDDDPRVITGTGELEEFEVKALPIHGVAVEGECEVTITIGETQSIILRAQSEILSVMNYPVRDGILEIGFAPDVSIRTDKGIYADIVMPEVDYLAVTGLASYQVSGAAQDDLRIDITGIGNVSAFDLPVLDCEINISGEGDCQVNVSDRLDVEISGVGHVRYMGSPTVSQDVSGVGSVQPVNP